MGKWAEVLRKRAAAVWLQPVVITGEPGLKLASSELSRKAGKLDFHEKSDFLKTCCFK